MSLNKKNIDIATIDTHLVVKKYSSDFINLSNYNIVLVC